MQGRPCGFSGQRCADSAVLHVPKCHLPPKQIPGLLHNGLPLRLLQPEPSRRLLRGSEELPSRDGIRAPGWPPEAVTSSWSQALWATLCWQRRLLSFQMLWQLTMVPSPRGSKKFSETRQTWRVRSSLIYRTDVCQLTLGGTKEGGEELNKNKGVSSQKVAYLYSNSLTPGVVWFRGRGC